MSSKFKPAASPKCFSCGKSVYSAEEKRHEDKIFHNICFGKWWKEQEKTKHDEFCAKNYGGNADVKPEYYRVKEPTEGAAQ